MTDTRSSPGTDDLLPCPFCGGEEISLHSDHAKTMFWASCRSCGLEAPTETGVTGDHATEYWNTRARGVAQPPTDPTNHHNALLCPYCNPDGLKFVPPSPVAGEWQPIETAPESIQKFAANCASDETRGGYIEFGGTVIDGRPFLICRNNDGWDRFDRWLILPSIEGYSLPSTDGGSP